MSKRCVLVGLVVLSCIACGCVRSPAPAPVADLGDLEARIAAYVPDERYRDDVFGLLVVKQGLAGLKGGSGGIGACLVDPATGEVVETGRNRQYSPYFRSDLHAEMDLLNRYEDRVRKERGNDPVTNPRDCGDLILFTSTEPCPMCLTRIINSGIVHMYYLNPDPQGGMAHRIDQLPEFWRDFAADRDFRQADCSPVLKQLAGELFRHSVRAFARKKVSSP